MKSNDFSIVNNKYQWFYCHPCRPRYLTTNHCQILGSLSTFTPLKPLLYIFEIGARAKSTTGRTINVGERVGTTGFASSKLVVNAWPPIYIASEERMTPRKKFIAFFEAMTKVGDCEIAGASSGDLVVGDDKVIAGDGEVATGRWPQESFWRGRVAAIIIRIGFGDNGWGKVKTSYVFFYSWFVYGHDRAQRPGLTSIRLTSFVQSILDGRRQEFSKICPTNIHLYTSLAYFKYYGALVVQSKSVHTCIRTNYVMCTLAWAGIAKNGVHK